MAGVSVCVRESERDGNSCFRKKKRGGLFGGRAEHLRFLFRPLDMQLVWCSAHVSPFFFLFWFLICCAASSNNIHSFLKLVTSHLLFTSLLSRICEKGSVCSSAMTVSNRMDKFTCKFQMQRRKTCFRGGRNFILWLLLDRWRHTHATRREEGK